MGCATSPERIAGGGSPEADVRARVEAYWGAMVEGSLDEAYRFEDPVFRKGVSLTNYIKRRARAGRWTEASVGKVEVDGDQAVVEVKTKVELAVPGAAGVYIPSTRNERWVLIDGQWYHVGTKGLGGSGMAD